MGLSEDQWIALITQIASELQSDAARSSLLQNELEYSLSRLWFAMREAPTRVTGAFERLREESLGRHARERAAILLAEESAMWALPSDLSLDQLTAAVAGEIRAVDQALMECRGTWTRSGDPNTDYLAWGGRQLLLIPRTLGPAPEPRRGQAFQRRGLIHHRALPANWNDISVTLYTPSNLGPGADGALADLFSAIFSKVDLDIVADGERNFHVAGLINEDELIPALHEQLETISTHGRCLGIVWPELTISPAMQAEVVSKLRAGALDEDGNIGFVVPGSWHRTLHGDRRNIASVLDGVGGHLFSVVKRAPFQLDRDLIEDIVPGREVPILLYGGVLIAFGICKDFCERRHPVPYGDLDVDLVIVPSYGEPNTMDEHVVAAGNLAVTYGARSFVVQQLMKGEAPWGSVLRPSQKPRGKMSSPIHQHKTLDRTGFSCTIS